VRRGPNECEKHTAAVQHVCNTAEQAGRQRARNASDGKQRM